MHYAYRNLTLKDTLHHRLELLTGRKIVAAGHDAKVPSAGNVDFAFKDNLGKEYFVRVKSGRITALDIGQIARHAALIHEEFPSAKFFLFVEGIDPVDKTVLGKVKVRVVALDRRHRLHKEEKDKSPYHSDKTGKLELSPKEQKSYFSLIRRDIKVVTPHVLAKEIGVTENYSKNILASLARRGVLTRFGRGKYVVVPPDIVYDRKGYAIDPLSMLEQLFADEPYYAAYNTALYIHGLSHQIPFEASVATTRQRRPLRIGNSVVRFVKISPPGLFGYQEQKYLDSYVKVSDIEKTIIDCIDRPDLCGGISEVTQSISEALDKIDADRLLSYLSKIHNKATIQRLGFILDSLRYGGYTVNRNLLNRLKNNRFRHRYPLDFTQTSKGRFSKRWKIIENVDCMSWKHA